MAVTFKADIAPLFRTKDLACMTPHGIDLGAAEWMCDPAPAFDFADHGNARRVFSCLSSGVMPPGEPWPAASIATYQSWMSDGFAV
jgi:hypothetical protein